MCNRHVADLIAEYEASRIDGDGELDDGDAEPSSRAPSHADVDEAGLLATVRARLAR
jgi:hypothetical protein